MSSSLQTKLIEALAVVFSLAYTWMYLKGELPEGYILAGLGAGLFAFLCWKRKIYAESALQFFYIGMAVYGYNLISESGTSADQVPIYACHMALNSYIGDGVAGSVFKTFYRCLHAIPGCFHNNIQSCSYVVDDQFGP